MTATGEKIPPKLPKINDWIIQICKEYITEYKESDIVEVLKFTPGKLSCVAYFSIFPKKDHCLSMPRLEHDTKVEIVCINCYPAVCAKNKPPCLSIDRFQYYRNAEVN